MSNLEKLFDVLKVASTSTQSKSSDSRNSINKGDGSSSTPRTTDDDVRECSVQLWERYIGLGISYHWVLCFQWNNPFYEATFEASEHERMLTPFMNEGKPDKKYDNWTLSETYKARKCSPLQIVELAENLCIGNGIYNAILNNCQDYATQLASLVKVTLPKGTGSYIRDPFNVEPKNKTRFKLLDGVALQNPEETDPVKEGYLANARRKVGEGVGYMLKDN